MKYVPLNGGKIGKFFIVDDSDYEYITQWNWFLSQTGYVSRTTSQPKHRKIVLHKVLLNPPEGFQVDHRNGNKLDNRRSNLRVATRGQNMANRRIQRNNKTGYKGVSYNKQLQKYDARLRVSNKVVFLGLFNDKKSAALAYNEAARKYHGEFARPNII